MEGNMGSREDFFVLICRLMGMFQEKGGKTIMQKTEQNQIMQKVWVGLPWTGSVSIHLGSQKERQGIWMQMEMGGESRW